MASDKLFQNKERYSIIISHLPNLKKKLQINTNQSIYLKKRPINYNKKCI